eukprot:6018156-Prorocentrum_lima.AAC.1
MTSSLVGSEMCIRDRSYTALHPTPHPLPNLYTPSFAPPAFLRSRASKAFVRRTHAIQIRSRMALPLPPMEYT